MYKDASASERLKNRQRSVKPLVDAYFKWVKEQLDRKGLDKSSKLVGALNDSINQEQFLRVFLGDGAVPPDNNDAERSIRSFCLAKHNWKIIDSKKGAKANAMLYSLAKTAKANSLKPYEYFSYLLTQLMNYLRGNVPKEELEKLMPWPAEPPDSCRKMKDQ